MRNNILENEMDGIFVVVPAKDEAENIGKVLKKIKRYCKDIILVDDGSKDSTKKIGKKEGVIVIRHITNLGKGAALKTGCDYAFSIGAKKVIAIDADGQHDPNDIPRFAEAVKTCDIVFGARTFNRNMPYLLKFGNRFINMVTRFLYGIKLKDTQCGYRAFTASAYKKIRWNSYDYSMESEMISNAGRHKLKYKEITIDTVYSDKYKGTTVFDGIKIVMNLFYWKLRGTGNSGKNNQVN